MKNSFIALLLFLYPTFAFSQEIKRDAFRFGNLPLLTEKKKIVEKWDKPKIARPKYECGFFSEDEQGKAYYQLLYKDFEYIGNEEVGYFLDRIKFNKLTKLSIEYLGNLLKYNTSVAEFQKIFTTDQTPQPGSDRFSIFMRFKGSEDAIIFRFHNGFLSEWEYWTPC